MPEPVMPKILSDFLKGLNREDAIALHKYLDETDQFEMIDVLCESHPGIEDEGEDPDSDVEDEES